MKKMTCVVIGGGYAGIHAIKAIQKNIGRNQSIRIILIDPNPYHIKKVLLFKPAVEKETIKIPWKRIFPSNVEVIKGYVTMINHKDRRITCQNDMGEEQLTYDNVVITVGSCFQKIAPNTGGISLSSPENGELIFNQWNENLALASKANSQKERKKLMTATVIGAGISGIETSAALAEKMRKVATNRGLNPRDVKVMLINSKKVLFDEGPGKLGIKLEERLFQQGVQVIHNAKAICENNGIVELDNGQCIPSGLCVWTIGLVPNPILSSWDIPLTTDGRVKVDESYRVKESIGIYCIGDCARIVNPRTGVEDQMTCKEAIAQARRLGKIIKADILHKKSPVHKTPMTTYCFGLGKKQGLVWVGLPKLNFYLSGNLGFWIRKLTWDIASLVK